ncbi:nuclear transport factor 2 family protein [Ruegeria sp. WL0004]|uniref:Nuclear transport factor 2 family protein n=1 Tax=Ruegeria marisflavi TaxID=2984152 RepID=A0ABT2WRM2_9RHOB|nr:adenylate/guanylate cyclase domain-containing protein [Ruegeria sp. WL0004]MCU9838312.1 nuclear transport factor 2 family protein [Ruegeria sp. WL0004]
MSAPLQPSPEIAAIARRWHEAYANGDSATMVNLLTDDALLCYVGTAPDEIGKGTEFRQAFGRFVDAHPRMRLRFISIDGFACGPVGWSITLHEAKAPDSTAAVVRTTLIFHLQQGQWRIAHVHNSIPRTNTEGLGRELARFDELLDAALSGTEAPARTGLATIMFTDIADSTAIAAAIGDALWSAAVKTHIGTVKSLIEGLGGTLIKSLGDGTMSSFPSARAALSAAAAAQQAVAQAEAEPRLRIRIGLHTGDLIAGDTDVFGTVVNKAARIAALAGPGEIRVSDATRLMVGDSGGFVFADPATVALRGLTGEHLTHLLEWRD